MTQFSAKVQKPYFGPFWTPFPHFSENENFPEKSGSVTFEHLWTPNFMQNIRKTNEPIPRKVRYGLTDGRTD